MRNLCSNLVKGKDYFENLVLDGRILLKWLKKIWYDDVDRTEFS
jgi:hypothetical protein